MNPQRLPVGKAASRHGAFTLVEMLVSIAVLAILGVIVAQILSSTTKTATGSEKRIDANNQARLIFDRMGSDLGAIAKNSSVNFLFLPQNGNDAFYFFSEATGYFSGDAAQNAARANSFSLVGYRVSDAISTNARFELERLGRGLQWDASNTASGASNGPGVAMAYLPATIAVNFDKALQDPYNNSSNLRSGGSTGNVPQWDVIGNLVFRMEFCFLLKDGNLSNIPVEDPSGLKNSLVASANPGVSDDSSQGYASGSRWFNSKDKVGYVCSSATAGAAEWSPLGWQDVQALVVAIAVLDAPNRKIADAAVLQKLAAKLPDFDPGSLDSTTGKPVLMSTAWGKVLEKSSVASEVGLPAGGLSGVRVFQQYFYLN